MDRESEQFLEWMAAPALAQVEVGGRRLRPGSRVRLRPRAGGDLFDSVLAGRTAIVEGIDEDEAFVVHVAVLVEDDPGKDLGEARHPAHRFFFLPSELEPVDEAEPVARPVEAKPEIEPVEVESPVRAPRVLVAGIGNLFFGDDGFGVEVARRLLRGAPRAGVEVVDFGIRGMDLAFALLRPCEAVILVDTLARGAPAGTVHLLEVDADESADALPDSHGVHPLAAMQLARRLGRLPARLFVVGCEPLSMGAPDDAGSMSVGLSAPVEAAVGRAVELVVDLAGELLAGLDGARPVETGTSGQGAGR